MNKNHEGYYDPTACEAVRRANRKQKKRHYKGWKRLTYKICEVSGFRQFME